MPDTYFRQLRNVELSTIYYIETQVDANWTGIEVVKGFPNFTRVSLPVISVRLITNDPDFLEIGSKTMNNLYGFVVDIFAKSDGQRLDLAQFLQDTIVNDWTYYLHSHASGGDGTLDRTADGKVKFVSFTQNSKLDFIEDVEAYDRFRHVLSFNVRKDNG